MQSFNIRLATREDEPAIQHIILTVYQEYGWPWFPDGYHKDLYDIEQGYFAKGGSFWVAELNGETVGTAGLEVFPSFPGQEGTTLVDGAFRGAGCDCSLERLYLLDKARGRGIGRAMLLHTIDHARAQNLNRMEIWSDKKLTMAHALYEKIGAIPIGERLCHDPDQSPEWGMTIQLN